MIMGERIRQLRLEKQLTQEELGKLVGVQRSAVQKWEKGHTQNLKRNVIERLSSFFGVSPSYLMGMSDIRNPSELKDYSSCEFKKVPMLGGISAGEPILACEEYGTYVVVNNDVNVDFCLRVEGDSMVNARIQDGDLVFIRKQPTVENGEIAAVLIDDEVTLKRVYITDEGIILKPENSAYQPKFYTEKDFKDIRILGKAVLFQSKL